MCILINKGDIITPYSGNNRYYKLLIEEEAGLNEAWFSRRTNLKFKFRIGTVNTENDKYVIIQMFCNKVLYYKRTYVSTKNRLTKDFINLALKRLYTNYIYDTKISGIMSMYITAKEHKNFIN